MNKRTLKAAIGSGDGSSLVMQTARARVEICYRTGEGYTLNGDIPLDLRDRAHGTPLTADKAHRIALECLAAYNKG